MKRNLIALICAFWAVGMTACAGNGGNCQENKEETLCGAFTEQREPENEDIAIFREVLGDVGFTPLSVATQVVAGLNYRFWCRFDDKSEDSPIHCFVTIYRPLQGDALLSKVEAESGGPQMKVVIDPRGYVARYLGENETSVHCDIQDDYWLPKDSVSFDTLCARRGQGILFLNEPGRQSVFRSPDVNSDPVGTMIHERGELPETYRCLGYLCGWFLAEVNGRAGFIHESLVAWDAISSF